MRNKKFARGQTLVLAAFTALLLSICLFMTIAVSWQIRNRIQLQHAADAQAFAEATQVARVYNLYAYTNRAIVGNIVTMTILHAYQSEIAAASDIFFGIMEAYAWGLAQEGCSIWRLRHCICSAMYVLYGMLDGLIPWISGRAARQLRNADVMFTDPVFGPISWLDRSVLALVLFQEIFSSFTGFITDLPGLVGVDLGGISPGLFYRTLNSLPVGALSLLGIDSVGGDVFKEMKKRNMASGDEKMNWWTKLVSNTKAIANDGSTLLSLLGVDSKQIQLTEVVNASRPSWTRDRGKVLITPVFLEPMFLLSNGLVKSKTGNRVAAIAYQVPYVGGGAGFYSSPPSTVLPSYNNFMMPVTSFTAGRNIASFDAWHVSGSVKPPASCRRYFPIFSQPSLLTLPFVPLFPGYITSGEFGGQHRGGLNLIGSPHSGGVHRLTNMKKYFKLKVYPFESFLNDADMGQPTRNIAFKTNNLSQSFDKATSQRNPWDLNIKVALPVEGKINLDNKSSTGSEAVAISKSITYYHHPNDWSEPPNYWNPFWRAKLHPFVQDLGLIAGLTTALRINPDNNFLRHDLNPSPWALVDAN